MVGDVLGTSKQVQDVLMFKTKLINSSWDDVFEEFFDEPTNPEEPETPTNETPETPINETPVTPETPETPVTPQNPVDETPDNNTPNATTPEGPGEDTNTSNGTTVASASTTMKDTSIPIIFGLLVFLSSLGILVRRK